MDRHPDLKVIAHHLGGVIPYLEGRVAHSFDQMGARTSDEDYETRKSLKKRPCDYFKDFYGDTAVEGARAATVCGLQVASAPIMWCSLPTARSIKKKVRAISATRLRC